MKTLLHNGTEIVSFTENKSGNSVAIMKFPYAVDRSLLRQSFIDAVTESLRQVKKP